jgi:molybdopterin-guanine dinucleotide biosynthesis protein
LFFFAYPFRPKHRRQLIARACTNSLNQVQAWEEVDNWGQQVILPLLRQIDVSQGLCADISDPNFNVIFEVGYAIGKGKPIYLFVYDHEKTDESLISKVGIFDTLGYKKYKSAADLVQLLDHLGSNAPLVASKTLDRKAPIYMVLPQNRDPISARIVSRVDISRLAYRSFSPSESSRLPVLEALEQVSQSQGVIVNLVSPFGEEAEIHNYRSAFVAGLAYGMGKQLLIFDDPSNNTPLDVRDLITPVRAATDTHDPVANLTYGIHDALTRPQETAESETSVLDQISFGDPTAENEVANLPNYYVETDEFQRAIRGEVNLLVGRKGTGKTALFYELRRSIRKSASHNIILDLKPEGYQLTKLKEDVLQYLSRGSATHLVSAFWEYLILMEIANKIIDVDQDRHTRDHRRFERYQRLRDTYYQDDIMTVQGDFSERMSALSDSISEVFIEKFKPSNGAAEISLDNASITELLHTEYIPALRDSIVDYLSIDGELWVLFDNIDKGWNVLGVTPEDTTLVTSLIESSRKIIRRFRAKIDVANIILFLRNGVYQLLMEGNPDYGKEARATLDWHDKDRLRRIIEERIRFSLNERSTESSRARHNEVFVPTVKGVETIDFMIEHSLFRPRNLIRLFTLARGIAINRGNRRIEGDDFVAAVASYSEELLLDLSRELRDIVPESDDILYIFFSEKESYTHKELHSLFEKKGLSSEQSSKLLETMLYYGALGMAEMEKNPVFIYDVGYNMKKFRAIHDKNPKAEYFIHRALHPSLGIIW